MNIKRTVSTLIFLSASLICLVSAYSQEYPDRAPALIVFYSPACHKCIEIKNGLMPQIEKEFKGRLSIQYRDITDMENFKRLLSLKEKYRPDMEINVPVLYLEGHLLGSKEIAEDNLRRFISGALNRRHIEEALPKVDLVKVFQRFNLLGITLAGLGDGINPCAFTVIVFFISYLAFQGYRKRELIVIGLTFIFTVFIAYLLIGLCLFNFLYALKGFGLAARIINIAIGVFSIILGVFALYDFFKFKKTKDTEALLLQLPKAIKNQIHSVIGLHYRKSPDKAKEANIFKLLLSAVITGFLVTLLEAVCTGQLYLPTITYIVRTSGLKLKLQAAGYLIYYNLLFVTPLFVIFLLALLGVTSEQFARFLKRHLGAIKIIMAILFFALGAILIYFQIPQKISKAAYPIEPALTSRSSDKAQETKQQDSFSWDFGQVKEGEILRHNFILHNTSQNVLNIKDVNTSCGCTVSKVQNNTLLLGESTLIEVQFNTKGYSGLVQQYVYVHTDSLDTSTKSEYNQKKSLSVNGERSRTIDNPVIRFIIKADVIKQ